jgi:hypothetical protein
MATTAIFAEILIVGLQATVWVALLVITILGPRQIDLAKLTDWSTLITAFVLAIAYTLGIVVDRVTDSVFDPWDQAVRKDNLSASLPSVHRMRLCIMSEGAGVAAFLDYVRSRVRIARSTAFNVALIISAAILLQVTRPEMMAGLSQGNLYALAAFGIGVFILAVFTWERTSRTYYWRVEEAYKIMCDKRQPSQEAVKLSRG